MGRAITTIGLEKPVFLQSCFKWSRLSILTKSDTVCLVNEWQIFNRRQTVNIIITISVVYLYFHSCILYGSIFAKDFEWVKSEGFGKDNKFGGIVEWRYITGRKYCGRYQKLQEKYISHQCTMALPDRSSHCSLQPVQYIVMLVFLTVFERVMPPALGENLFGLSLNNNKER